MSGSASAKASAPAGMSQARVIEIRKSPEQWFHRFARVKDLVTQLPIISKVKPLQRRGFAHYEACQAAGVPCRQIWLKGRRAGGSDGCSALVYLHAQNYTARIGQLGTNYRTAHNMLDKVKHYGQHDDFPGWGVKAGGMRAEGKMTVSAEDYYGDELSTVPWNERTEKVIDGKIVWPHGSTLELYTANNPESARSAGLQCFHWTEFFRAPKGGATDGGETLNAMLKTVPKRGFTFIGLEGTAEGALGSGYELAKSSRWPEGVDWWKPWEMVWPQNVAEIGAELQFVLIFAAWYEDDENTLQCTEAEEAKIRASLTEKEKLLIARYQQDGPHGPRLGAEVDTTVWNQLKWRRATIEHECKQGGEDEFAQEYPGDPEEAFRASGSPALDRAGVMVLEAMARDKSNRNQPAFGQLTQQSNGVVSWVPTERDQCTIIRWEEPIIPASRMDHGGRYIIGCDPMSGADQVTGTGKKDRHSVMVGRDAYSDHRGEYHQAKVVARIKPPCQWESEVLARYLYLMSLYYGGATIVVEASSSGVSILKTLSDEYNANVWQREIFDDVTQRMTKKLGWMQSEPARRILVATMQKYVREEMFEIRCMHAVGELLTLCINPKGKAVASGSNFDDDAIALALLLELLPSAHEYPPPAPVRRRDPNSGVWK